MIICNVEADELLFQTVSSTAKRSYVLKTSTGSSYPLGRKYTKGGRFSQTEVEKALNKLGKVKDEDYTIECNTVYGDMGIATYLLEKKLRKIFYLTKCSRMDCWIGPSDGSNFRFKSAVTQPYKSNRGEKPPLLAELKEYLKMVHGAQEIHGYEADDALGIYQTDNTIAVHCDKDIFMVEGLHLNTMTDQITMVTDPGELHVSGKALKGTGIAFFYAQMLMGDPTDTIPSLAKGYGPVKIQKIFEGCDSESSYFDRIKTEYITQIGLGWEERMQEQADLVYIVRNDRIKGSEYIRRFL